MPDAVGESVERRLRFLRWPTGFDLVELQPLGFDALGRDVDQPGFGAYQVDRQREPERIVLLVVPSPVKRKPVVSFEIGKPRMHKPPVGLAKPKRTIGNDLDADTTHHRPRPCYGFCSVASMSGGVPGENYALESERCAVIPTTPKEVAMRKVRLMVGLALVAIACANGTACQQSEPEAATPNEAPQPAPKPEVIEVEPKPVEPPPPPPTASELLPGARVLYEEIMDAPLKTQIELRVAIPGNITKEQLTRYMHQLYVEQMARTGFKARPTPNAVYAFLYTEEVDWKTNGAGWVGRIAKAAADDRPSFDNFLLSGPLLEQCREVLDDTERAELRVSGPTVHIRYDITDGYYATDKPTSREIGKEMIDSFFLFAGLLYTQARELDSTEWLFTYEGKTVGRINLTRASYAALESDAELRKAENVMHAAWGAVGDGKLSGTQAQAREDRAFAAAHRRMLKKLPAGAVTIPKKYLP